MKVQEKQAGYKSHIEKIAMSGALTDAFSYIENGEVKAVFGMQPFWQGRSTVWALIGYVDNWVSLHKGVLNLMNEYAVKRRVLRLEMTTEVGFIESERWASMLGFEEESLMRNFGVDGKDHKMWVRLWQQQSHL